LKSIALKSIDEISRFLADKRESYPALPEGYFREAAEEQLTASRERALRERREEFWLQFPDPLARAAPWDAAATLIFLKLADVRARMARME
jgi:hypothetical protein